VADRGSLEALAVSASHVLEARPTPRAWAHPLHDPARAWPETNCYVDLWIEVLHALKVDPVACFGFTLSTDFEGDQWTFFKPQFSDLYELYGVDVQELTIWRPLLDHVREQVGRKRLVLVEMDAFHLPDLVATDYRKNHAKTTIAIESFDEEKGRVGYFHNAAYAEVDGEDYEVLFKQGGANMGAGVAGLPPYCEFVKYDRLVVRPHAELAAIAAKYVKRELARRPKHNPLTAFRERFPVDAAWLAERDLKSFHAYAFATIRQLGACYELTAEHLRWIDREDPAHAKAAEHFEAISTGAKALLFKVARMVNSKKKPNFDETMASMETAWAAGMETISARYGV
jgi:hypothetical protein